MFKRLFFLSGIIAFVLACATMWFWYLPMKEQENRNVETESVAAATDSTLVSEPDTLDQ